MNLPSRRRHGVLPGFAPALSLASLESPLDEVLWIGADLFRALAYAAGGCVVLALIPLCGALVNTIALVVVGAIALARMHETDPWRAVTAILAPGLLLLICLGWLIAALIMSMVVGFSH